MIRVGEKNDALDAKVLRALSSGQLRATQVVTATGANHRDVDRSLDRLRRAGKIEFISPVAGWKLNATGSSAPSSSGK